MARTTIRRILILALGGMLLIPVLAPGPSVADEARDEVVIEGTDQEPSQSSFDYADTVTDTSPYSGLGTKDTPRPKAQTQFREPSLDRDTGSVTHGQLETSKTTAVDEFSTFELLMIGAGALTVLVVI